MPTLLTPNFTLDEMLLSQTATRLGYAEQYQPSPEIINNLRALCENILQPLREQCGRPVIVSSGYRCLRTNTAIGGVPNSQHVSGQAADINIGGWSVEQAYQFVKHSGLPYDQLIQEFGNWVHVSFAPARRGQNLRATTVNGKTVYTPD